MPAWVGSESLLLVVLAGYGDRSYSLGRFQLPRKAPGGALLRAREFIGFLALRSSQGALVRISELFHLPLPPQLHAAAQQLGLKRADMPELRIPQNDQVVLKLRRQRVGGWPMLARNPRQFVLVERNTGIDERQLKEAARALSRKLPELLSGLATPADLERKTQGLPLGKELDRTIVRLVLLGDAASEKVLKAIGAGGRAFKGRVQSVRDARDKWRISPSKGTYDWILGRLPGGGRPARDGFYNLDEDFFKFALPLLPED